MERLIILFSIRRVLIDQLIEISTKVHCYFHNFLITILLYGINFAVQINQLDVFIENQSQ